MLQIERRPCPGSLISTESTDSRMKFQMPFFGLRARSSDHFTSSAVIGEPSENLMPSRKVSVKVSPSSETCQAVARPG